MAIALLSVPTTPSLAALRPAQAAPGSQPRVLPQRQQQQQQWRRRRRCGGPRRRLAAAAAAGAAEAAGAAPAGHSAQPWINPAALRKVTAAADANEALDLLCSELCCSGFPGAAQPRLEEGQCRELLLAALDRGNSALALSVFRAMSSAAAAGSGSASSLLASLDGDAAGGGGGPGLAWPPASIQTAAALVVGLSRVLLTREAIALINSVRSRGLASTEDVCFGHVVGCPQDG